MHWSRNKAHFLYFVPFLQVGFQEEIVKSVEVAHKFLRNDPIDKDHDK
jgi:hypothetical protein